MLYKLSGLHYFIFIYNNL